MPFAIVSSLPVQAQQVVQIPCSSLRGAGSFSKPLAIGVVTRPVRITNCSVWRLVPLVNLPANPYVLGVEKIDGPLRSTLTPNFDLVINP